MTAYGTSRQGILDTSAPEAMMQCKDIPTAPVLRFIFDSERWATILPGYEHSVQNAMPPGTPEKMARAKMARLIRSGLVDGCVCGCRGDFELTAKGTDAVVNPAL